MENNEEKELHSLVPETKQARAVILVAEDSEESVMALSEYLGANGYKVISAANGVEAIEMAQKIHPDLILMDIQMPVMDGLEATRKIRHTPGIQYIPIIAMTAMALPGDRERCKEAGADTYISKPVRFKTLLREIEEILNSKQQEGSNGVLE